MFQKKWDLAGLTKTMSVRLLIALVVVCSALGTFKTEAFAAGTSYYVSTTGKDTNAGTSSKPWKTIQKAVNTANPGDTIYVMAGTYKESVKIQRSGSSSSPITLTNYKKQVVTINGGSSPALLPSGSGAKYWVINGLKLVSSGNYTVQYNSWGCNGTCNGIDHMTFRKNYISGAVQIYGAYTLFQGNEVDGTKNNGNGGNGIQEYYDVSHNNTFQSNYIHNFSSRGIWSMHRTHDDVFESNTIKNINNSMGMCIDLDGYGDIEWRQTVTGNILNHCVYAGIQLENAFASSVKNNTMTNAIGIGIAVISYQSCQVGGESNQYGSSSDCRGLSTNNVVQGNKLSAATSYGYNGIVNWYTAGLSILNNTITASDFKHSAINVCGTTSQVKGSVVSGNTTIISGTSLAPTTKLVV